MPDLLRWLLEKGPLKQLNGKKTLLAMVIAAVLAANAVDPFLNPTLAQVLFYCANMLGLVGLRHALDKARTPPPADAPVPPIPVPTPTQPVQQHYMGT